MYEFKVGDIVECIRVDGNSYIKLGQTYKVLRVTGNCIIIMNRYANGTDREEWGYNKTFFRKKESIERLLEELVWGTKSETLLL